MWLKGAKKRLGGSVLYQAMGQTRQRELASEVTNPRTESQMGQRVKWANLVNLYRANRNWMKYAYETKKASQSEYNKFMSLNVASSRIYLPKDIANAGGCVVDAYLMTQGSLPSIEFVPAANNVYASNILVGMNAITSNTTIASFSQTVLANNPAIREGDQLSFVRMTQMTNASTGVPYMVVREYEVIIDSTNNASLWNYLPETYFTTSGTLHQYLAVSAQAGRVGGFCMILSRTISGKTYVSSQRVILVGMDAFISAWSSSAALQAAIDSYGVSDDAFLSSTYAAQDNQAATQLALLSVQYNSEGPDYVAGSRFVRPTIADGDDVVFKFNGSLTAAPTSMALNTSRGIITLGSPSYSGSEASGSIPEGTGELENVVIYQAFAVVNNLQYQINFLINNEDTIEGIE